MALSRISGTTRLAGVTGWPLGHTLSPAIHNAAYQEMGLDWLYLPLPIERVLDLSALVEGLKALPFVGINVTMPYKESVMDLCDQVATVAELVGAVNTLHFCDGRVIGYNTDGRGLVESLAHDADFTAKGSRIVLLGAGGAAAAAFAAFVLEGAASVTVVNRTVANAEIMIARFQGCTRGTSVCAVSPDADAQEAVAAADLVVNATPLGMGPDDDLPMPAAWLHGGLLVADMVYRPATTALLDQAGSAGARVLGGLGMLVAQAATSIEIWDDNPRRRAPRETMRAAAQAVLRVSEP